MTIKTIIFTHRSRVSLARFTFCWWRHNRLLMTSQWPDSCDAITWVLISNSSDIDFVHGNIRGRLRKKPLISHKTVNLVVLNLFFKKHGIYLHMLSFLNTKMQQVIEILSYERKESAYSIIWLLMTWWRKEPGHEQRWYWPYLTRRFKLNSVCVLL